MEHLLIIKGVKSKQPRHEDFHSFSLRTEKGNTVVWTMVEII